MTTYEKSQGINLSLRHGKIHSGSVRAHENTNERQKLNRASYFLRRGLLKARMRDPFQPKTGSRRRSTSSMP